MDPKPNPDRGRPVDIFVGNRIRLRREHLRLSAAELAGLVGLSEHLLTVYESGALQIDAELLLVIGEALMVPIGYFFQGVRDTPAPAATANIAPPRPASPAPISAHATAETTPTLTPPTLTPPAIPPPPDATRELSDIVRLWHRLSRSPRRRRLLEMLNALDALTDSLDATGLELD